MAKKISFQVENAELLTEENLPDSHFATAKVEAFSSGWNRHDSFVSPENLRENSSTISEKPLIFEIEGGLDFGKHSDTTIPAGFVVPGSERIVEKDDGRYTLVVDVKIWKRYSGRFLDIFHMSGMNDKKKSVSVEMILLDPEEMEKGCELKKWEFAAICVLGDFYTPASPGANMEILSFVENETKSYEAALFQEFGKYRDIDFTIPNQVKLSAQKGLKLNERLSCGTSTDLAISKFLIKNEKIDSRRLRIVSKRLQRLKSSDISNKESPNWCKYQMWGGKSGERWSIELESKLNEIDEKAMEYFETDGDNVEMVYKKRSDFPPALKGINPPLTVSQANAIARQADAIGESEEKSGWAIAISNFKKTHTVKDGKWVKKVNSEFADKLGEREEEEFVNKSEELKKAEDFAEEEKPEAEMAEVEEKPEAEMAEDEEKPEAEMAEEEKPEAEMAEDEDEEDEDKEDDDEEDEPVSEMSEFQVLQAENETLKAEVLELREFKANVEKEKYEVAIGALFADVMDRIPEEKLNELKELSSEFSLDSLETFSNKVKAVAFEFSSKENGKEEKEDVEDFVKMGLPFSKVKNVESIW